MRACSIYLIICSLLKKFFLGVISCNALYSEVTHGGTWNVGIEGRSVACKASTLLTELSLWSCSFLLRTTPVVLGDSGTTAGNNQPGSMGLMVQCLVLWVLPGLPGQQFLVLLGIVQYKDSN